MGSSIGHFPCGAFSALVLSAKRFALCAEKKRERKRSLRMKEFDDLKNV
jgi:hypothetical protein